MLPKASPDTTSSDCGNRPTHLGLLYHSSIHHSISRWLFCMASSQQATGRLDHQYSRNITKYMLSREHRFARIGLHGLAELSIWQRFLGNMI
eukprot:scaffold39583_cov22-Prasinocladus_malaysianus.AAC.1